MSIAFRHAEVVLERIVGGLERVVEFEALEHIIVPAGLVGRAVLWVDRPANRPDRTLLALDPDEDGLLDARIGDSVDDPFGEAALRRFPPHRHKDTIGPAHRLASALRSAISFLLDRSSASEPVAPYALREHQRLR